MLVWGNEKVVPRAGLEPTTCGLGIRRSVQLSYRSIINVYGIEMIFCEIHYWRNIHFATQVVTLFSCKPSLLW